MMRRSSGSSRKLDKTTKGPSRSSPAIESPITAAKSELSLVPQELVIRSLRRRFWQALQKEDATLAVRIYQATRADWEHMLYKEASALQRGVISDAAPNTSCGRRKPLTSSSSSKKEQGSLTSVIPVFQKQHRSGGGGLRGRLNRGSISQSSGAMDMPSQNDSLNFVAKKTHTIKDDKDPNATVILPQVLKPCDFFVEDDFRPPSGPYLEFPSASGTSGIDSPSNNEPGNNPRRGSWFRRGPQSSSRITQQEERETRSLLLLPPRGDPRRTTPLHEAARIGSGELVRCLLEWAGGGDHYDTNVKNGQDRTPLHAAAGGLTMEEATRVKDEDDIAILAPKAPHADNEEAQHAGTHSGSCFRLSSHHKSRSNLQVSQRELMPAKKTISDKRWNALTDQRIDATMALLTSNASTNAVDKQGRTALHYAAALGRTKLSFSLFNSFGTLLTVVDGLGCTPAELAAQHNHAELAAQLESRALLYMDPLDLDLLESLQEQNGENSRGQQAGSISPPFSWFTTFSADRIRKEREFRVRTTLDRMQRIVQRLNAGRSGRDLILCRNYLHSRSNSSDQLSTTNHSSSSARSTSSSPVPEQDLSSLDRLNDGAVTDFLAHHSWDVKQTLSVFYEDPVGCFAQAKISLPPANAQKKDSKEEKKPLMCLICCEEFDATSDEWRNLNCSHGFCVSCLGDYIADRVRSREFGLAIHCPHHECTVAMSSAEVTELVPSKEIEDMMIETANNNFVIQAKDFRFCPHKGCSNVIKFVPPKNKPLELHNILSASGAVCCTPESHTKRKENSPFITYEGMYDESYFDCRAGTEPRRAHRFCFHCGENSHWPVSCQRLEQWNATVEEHVKEVESEEGDDYNEVSHKLWLKANTRPCPKCKAPIEKNDGCNHMTCSNPTCKHEFCWICRNDWSLHGTSTGGFFRCNRWAEDGEEHQFYDKAPTAEEIQAPTNEDLSDPRRMRAIYGTAMHESRVAQRRSRDMARFLHHYQRFNAHADSARLEARMADTCAERLKPIVLAAIEFSGDPEFNFGGKGLSFVFDAFTELRECRSVLQHSYAFSYFRYERGNKSSRNMRRKLAEGLAFEQMQSDLEMITEQMSDLVARAHMRATQSQILYLTLTAAQKRRDFSSYVMRILAKSKEEGESCEEGSDRSSGSEVGAPDRVAARLPFFRPIAGTPTGDASLITGMAPHGDVGPTMIDRQRDEGFFGDLGTDPALQASIQAFRETTGALDLLRLGISFDSQVDDDMFEEPGRQWACPACTYINTRGISCAMCGTPSFTS